MPSHWHTFTDKHYAYFITCTLVEWLPLFTQDSYRSIIIDSLAHLRQHKNTQLNAFVVMPTHLHAILWPDEAKDISSILRDFKRHTSRAISRLAEQQNDSDYLDTFLRAREQNPASESIYQVWQEGSHPEAIFSFEFAQQKLNYIHNNPVKAGLIGRAEDWAYSSASVYLLGIETYPAIDLLISV